MRQTYNQWSCGSQDPIDVLANMEVKNNSIVFIYFSKGPSMIISQGRRGSHLVFVHVKISFKIWS